MFLSTFLMRVIFVHVILKYYKRRNPSSSEEVEFMENLFNCLCSSLLHAPNKEFFLKGEGLELMILMLRQVRRLC